MKKKIRITENELNEIIKNAVSIIIEELGGTSSFSINSPAGSVSDPTGQQKNNIDVPLGADTPTKKRNNNKNGSTSWAHEDDDKGYVNRK